MQAEDWQLDDLFWGNPPAKEKLEFTSKKILENIDKIKTIPIKKRQYLYKMIEIFGLVFETSWELPCCSTLILYTQKNVIL